MENWADMHNERPETSSAPEVPAGMERCFPFFLDSRYPDFEEQVPANKVDVDEPTVPAYSVRVNGNYARKEDDSISQYITEALHRFEMLSISKKPRQANRRNTGYCNQGNKVRFHAHSNLRHFLKSSRCFIHRALKELGSAPSQSSCKRPSSPMT